MSRTIQYNVQFSVPTEQLPRKEQIPVIGQSFLQKLRGIGLEEVGGGGGEKPFYVQNIEWFPECYTYIYGMFHRISWT
jgi:hypothetical protein